MRNAPAHVESTPALQAARHGKVLRLRTMAVGWALILAFIGSTAYDGWRLSQQITRANERELGNLAKALSEETSRSLDAVDVLLRETAAWYEAPRPPRPPDGLTAALGMRAVGVAQVSVLSIVDASGWQIARSRATGEPLADVSDRPYFTRQREKAMAGLFINEPIVTRTERIPALVLSRRLNTPTGAFDGVVTAIVTLAQLQAAYSALDLGEGSSLVLTLADGTIVARQPTMPTTQAMPTTPTTQANARFPAELVALKGGQLIDRVVSPIDGRAKLVAAVDVGSQPLILAITRDQEEALIPWYDEMRSAVIRTVLLSLLVMLTIAGLLRQMRRLEQGEAALRASAEEKARFEARLQQSQKLEALGTLAGGIAHDFNNSLGAILGFGEMAQQRAEPGTPIRRHIDRVMQSGARARLLVRRILDFSRNSVTERVPVNLQAVVEEVVGMLAPTLPPSLALDAHLESGSAAVIGDSTQLYQVAMNLCTNAVHAVGDAGVVTITLKRVTLAEHRALLHGELEPGPHLCLEVADTGPGIAPDVLARMFDPFFTTKKVGEGSGLGLSVVHGIVSALGGAIDVAGRLPHGCVVTVWLPVGGEVEVASAAVATAASAWPAGRGQAVMVVDDERALLELAEELLAGLGYEPVGYETAEAAWAAFEADPTRFDAVITDLALPGMQGNELLQRLLAVRPALPVILMSGNLSLVVEQQSKALGVDALLHKPLGLQDLSETLAKALTRGLVVAAQG
ncbi:MAG: sensor hybrid histidine kinase [Rhizobacter sp.]|nr:sensor hybrid histidine kinase [Rhizobacter sp.]